MEQNKKQTIIKIVAIVVVIALAVAALAIWASIYRPFDTSMKTVSIDLVDEANGLNEHYQFRVNSASLGELIKANKDKLKIEYSDGAYGMFITSIGGFAVDASKAYVAILTSDSEFIDSASSWNVTANNSKGVPCTSSTVGADTLALKDGQSYILIVSGF